MHSVRVNAETRRNLFDLEPLDVAELGRLPRPLGKAGEEEPEVVALLEALEGVGRLGIPLLGQELGTPAREELLQLPPNHLVHDHTEGDAVGAALGELAQEAVDDRVRNLVRVRVGQAELATLDDDRVVGRQELAVRFRLEEPGVLGVAGMVHRRRSLRRQARILRSYRSRVSEKPKARRLTATEARTEFASLLREFRMITEPSDSIGDRAIRIGTYKEDSAVLLPLVDFERALELEEFLEELLLELAVSERVAKGPGKTYSVEEVARELGLADELGQMEA